MGGIYFIGILFMAGYAASKVGEHDGTVLVAVCGTLALIGDKICSILKERR
jgi:hypothetical protein